MQENLIRVCRQVITLLTQKVGTCNNRLARRLEILNGRRQVLQLAQTSAKQAAELRTMIAQEFKNETYGLCKEHVSNNAVMLDLGAESGHWVTW